VTAPVVYVPGALHKRPLLTAPSYRMKLISAAVVYQRERWTASTSLSTWQVVEIRMTLSFSWRFAEKSNWSGGSTTAVAQGFRQSWTAITTASWLQFRSTRPWPNTRGYNAKTSSFSSAGPIILKPLQLGFSGMAVRRWWETDKGEIAFH